MADNSQANSMGYITPAGTDPIADGDDAISNNARITADLITTANNNITTLTNNAPITGHGNPNDGPVYGAGGQLYTDLDATAGARLWINTGSFNAPAWHVVAGDTGWVDLAAGLENGWTAAELRIRRVGSHVYLFAQDLDSTAATAKEFTTVPTGFRPSTYLGLLGTIGTAAGNQPLTIQFQGPGPLAGPTGTDNIWLSDQWVTDEAWPTI